MMESEFDFTDLKTVRSFRKYMMSWEPIIKFVILQKNQDIHGGRPKTYTY